MGKNMGENKRANKGNIGKKSITTFFAEIQISDVFNSEKNAQQHFRTSNTKPVCPLRHRKLDTPYC